MTTRLSTGVHVALLRGVNVGGHGKLPMKQLAAIFESCGAEDVRTWIQSGNVVFRAAPALAQSLPDLVGRALVREAGLDVPMVLRSARALERIVAGNPFLELGLESKLLHVGFLTARPGAKQVAALDPDRSPPDVFEVRGSEVYVACPGGVAKSRLTNDWFDRTLGVSSTMRNWNTVQKLLELCRAASSIN